MRSVPLLAFKAGFAGTILVVIAGCGGTGSTPANTSLSAPAPATASNSGPAGSSSSAASTPGSSSTVAPPPSGSSNASPNPSPSPTPTSAGTTISGIEQMSGWDSCDTCSGGGTIAYSMTPGLSYPQPGTT